MRKNLRRKLIILLVVAAVLVFAFRGCFSGNDAGPMNQDKYKDADLNQDIGDFSRANTYSSYLETNKDVESGAEAIEIDVTSFTGDGRVVDVEKEETVNGVTSKVMTQGVLTVDGDETTWTVPGVPKDGMYNILVEYVTEEYYVKETAADETAEGIDAAEETAEAVEAAEETAAEISENDKVYSRGVDIERQVEINGESPFDGAKTIRFSRQWKDAGPVKEDNQGNQIRPSQTENFATQTAYCKDDRGFTAEPYQFLFKAGENTLTMKAENEFFIITKLTLVPVLEFRTYEEYLAEQPTVDMTEEMKDYCLTIEGESSDIRSHPSLYPRYDRSSPATYPNSIDTTVLNYIGGDPWNMAGQWIQWTFDVPNDGYYNITIKGRQMYSRGSISCRSLYIDNEIPFEDVSSIAFNYDTAWNLMTLADENGTPFRFYLSAGTHTIRLEATLGGMGPLLSRMEDSIYRLNDIYRQVLVLTGPNPDRYRDYKLADVYPEVLKAMDLESKRLYKLVDDTKEFTGEMNDRLAVAQTLAHQLEQFVEENDRITKSFSNFKDNITSFGTASQNMAETKLDVDQIFIHGENVTPDSKADNGLTRAWHEIKACAASYTKDYNNLGDVYDEGEDVVEVWIVTGRDQSTVLKTMVDDTFTPMTEETLGHRINVNVKLVQADAILTAVVAGNGPDVVLTVDGWFAVNYAMRNAVEDLTQFEDFDEVIGRVKNEDGTYNYDNAFFYESALEPLTYISYDADENPHTGIYGLPETQLFSVLFYRTDVLEELGLEVPKTWDDLLLMLPTIQGKNMSVGIPYPDINSVDMSGFNSLIYQNGGQIYSEDGKRTLIDSEAGVKAFKLYTSFYNDYGLPTVYDFVSRFRSGEMPIAVGQYSLYNTLAVSAPEIRGLWEFSEYLGTPQFDEEGNPILDENGNQVIDNTVHSNGACCLMIATDDEEVKQRAWEFMKWWVREDTQVRFGREMESILGSSARYATANRAALRKLAWSADQLEVLESQMAKTKGFPEIAGGYSTTRHMTNAIRKVINDKDDPREVLMSYTRTINEEITIKRQQLNLPIDEKKN